LKATNWRVGIRLPAYASGAVQMPGGASDILNYAERVEEAGFDSIWVIDHPLVAPALYATSWFDPIDLLAAVSARTSTVRLGTAILVVPLWNPVLLAKRIATLDYLAGGRFILGVGPGWFEPEFQAVDVPKRERGSRTDESLQLMEHLWTEESVTFSGRHFQVEDVTIEPRLPRRPPVWVAGGSLTRAAGTGDAPRITPSVLSRIVHHEGWIARSGGSDMEDVTRDWNEITDASAREGRDAPVFAHAQFVHIVDSTDRDAVLDEQLAAFRKVMGPTRAVEDLRASYLFGTIDEILDRIARLRDVGLEYLIVNPVLPDLQQLNLVQKHILDSAA
jgi:probable F420-dependent oxidoreductase